jgi:hypothetical protein
LDLQESFHKWRLHAGAKAPSPWHTRPRNG